MAQVVLWNVETLVLQAESLLGLSFEAEKFRGVVWKWEEGMLSECLKQPSPAAAGARGGHVAVMIGPKSISLRM